MVQSFNVKLENMEVRKVEEVVTEIDDKVYRSLNVHFDDVNCDRLVFKDKDIANKEKYKRSDIGTLELSIITKNVTKTGKNGQPYVGEKTDILIKSFTPASA